MIDTNSICIIELVYRYINPYTLRTKEKQEDQKKLNIYTNWKNKLQSGELKKSISKGIKVENELWKHDNNKNKHHRNNDKHI